jgi:hypothetical protein
MNKPRKRKVDLKRLVAAVNASTQRHTTGDWKTEHPGTFRIPIKPASAARKAVRKGIKRAVDAYEKSQKYNEVITDRKRSRK